MPAKNNSPRTITFKGETLTILEWAKRLKLSPTTIKARIDRLGWTPEKALSAPANTKFGRGRPGGEEVRACPRMRKHVSGQGYARWMENGRRYCRYFGAWGSAEAKEAYRLFVGKWSEGMRSSWPMIAGHVLISDLVGRWLDRCKARYLKLGKQTSEYHCHRAACGVLLDTFASRPAAEFGIEDLEAVRGAMVRKRWVRKTVNKHTARIVAAFGWGVGRKLVPADVHYALSQIDPLRPGQTVAAEPAPVRSVPESNVAAVLVGDYLHPLADRRAVLAAMIRLQLVTGWRPAQICGVRPELIDRTGAEWRYVPDPDADKNYHRGGSKPLWVGPRAQAILAPLIDDKEPGRPCFHFKRVRYTQKVWRAVTPDEYAAAVRRACDMARIPRWHPHQLRHNKATALKKLYESDAAAAAGIGTTPDVAARIYADPQEVVDRRIAREAG